MTGGTFWPRVNGGLAAAKRHRFAELPRDGLSDLFAPEAQPDGTAACTICQRHDVLRRIGDDPQQRACTQCHAFVELGRDALEARYLGVAAAPAGDERYGGLLGALGFRYRFAARAEDALPAGADSAADGAPTLLALNRTDVVAVATATPPELRGNATFGFRFLGSRSPLQGDGAGYRAPVEFDAMANRSHGAPQLGVLRMDVDDLGALFRGASATGLAGVAALSLLLRIFFEGHVGHLVDEINRGDAERVAVIYAGGDDLFAVGSWSALPILAGRVREDLRRLAAGNPTVHISAGLAGVPARFPIHRAAELAHEALDGRAKRPRGDGNAKDAMDFLGTTFVWTEFDTVRRWQEKLVELVQPSAGAERAGPRGVLQLLEDLYLQQQAARLRPTPARARQSPTAMLYGPWLWRGAYALARMLDRSPPGLRGQVRDLQQALCAPESLQSLAIAARWAELLVRGAHTSETRMDVEVGA